jgi:HAD superfamily hydrolase (TIGR01509 family)
MASVKTILFDVDGTLVDSNEAHVRAWIAALREGGYDVPAARVRPLLGMGGDKLLPALGVGLTADDEPGTTIAARRKALFLEREAPRLRPTHGARELVEFVRAEGLRRVVASSASDDELDALLRAAGVEDLFDATTSSDDAASSKPDPDIVRAALARSETDASQAVMIGDTRFDVDAAARVGVPCITLRCGGRPDDELAEAIATFDDPADLEAALAERGVDALIEARGAGVVAARRTR